MRSRAFVSEGLSGCTRVFVCVFVSVLGWLRGCLCVRMFGCLLLLDRGVVCVTPCVRSGLVSCVTDWLALARAARLENGFDFVLSFRSKNELQHFAAHSESLLHAYLRRSCAPARRDMLSSYRVRPHWQHAPVRIALARTAHRSPHGTTIKTWL